MRYLGIDYGTKRIGLALSDSEGKMAFPLSVIKNEKQAASLIAEICKKEAVNEIIVGESKDFKGEPNAVMEKIEKFKTELEKITGLVVHYEPEYMTSAQADRVHFQNPSISRKSGLNLRRPKVKNDKLDASAAALILQSYLDKRQIPS